MEQRIAEQERINAEQQAEIDKNTDINAAQQKQLQEVKALMEEMQRYTFMITDYDNSK